MKKVIYIVGIIALIAAIMVMPAAAFEPGECDIYVHDGESIMETIKSASPGDTICVYNGTYGGGTCHFYGPDGSCNYGSDCFAFCKPNITVKGEGADVVTWDGGAGDSEIDFGDAGSDARGCVIAGFKIVNAQKGVGVGPTAPDCIIRNCVFEGITYQYGIPISSQNITFRDNVVTGATGAYGAVHLAGDSCTIVNNTIINNNGAGLLLYPQPTAANNTITKNNLSSNGKGFFLYNAGEGNKIYLNDVINTPNVAYGGTPPSTIYWNSTEEIEYVYDSTEYTNYSQGHK